MKYSYDLNYFFSKEFLHLHFSNLHLIKECECSYYLQDLYFPLQRTRKYQKQKWSLERKKGIESLNVDVI